MKSSDNLLVEEHEGYKFPLVSLKEDRLDNDLEQNFLGFMDNDEDVQRSDSSKSPSLKELNNDMKNQQGMIDLISPHSNIWNNKLFSPSTNDSNKKRKKRDISPEITKSVTTNLTYSPKGILNHSLSSPVNSNELLSNDQDRITNDNRTTLMIKNIPNKFTQSMLLDLIDKDFLGL